MFRKIQHVHFVGIGGIGMCGIAELLKNQGMVVSGSDLSEGATVQRLRSLGISVFTGHSAGNIQGADVVVYSSAVARDNAELQAAEEGNIPVIRRAEMLAELMRLKDGIAVAGTHGKTTTTSLISHVLETAGLDPTSVIGGRVISSEPHRTGAKMGQSNLLVAEADESDGSFLRLAPVHAVVTNIDPEHLEAYGSYEDLKDAFVHFINAIPFWGLAVVCLDHPGVQSILPKLTRRITTYGFSAEADLVASDVKQETPGVSFTVRQGDKELGRVRIRLPGDHNISNTLGTLAIALELEVPFQTAADALESFLGIERRFETKGREAGVLVVDDYGHHPAEIRATLSAARDLHQGRIVTVFQPHRFTRTRDLFDEFATAFSDADVIYVCDIYSAGETPIPGATAEALAQAIETQSRREVHFAPDLDELATRLPSELADGDLVITLGAGNISSLGPRLLQGLRETQK
jgi:UDP-N-acetylmuramate--alanine ligase